MASENVIQISWRAGIGWWCPGARRGRWFAFLTLVITQSVSPNHSQALIVMILFPLLSASFTSIFGKASGHLFPPSFLTIQGNASGHPFLKNIWEINSYISVRCLMNGNLCRFYSSPSPTVGRKENKAGYKILQNKIQPGILRINSNRDCFEEISLSTTTWCNHQYYIMFVSHSK